MTHSLKKKTLVEKMQKFSKKILNFMVVGARQSFQFFRQKASLLGVIEVCFNLGIRFCITWLALPNYKKNCPYNIQF